MLSNLTPDIIELLRQAEENSPLKCEIVDSDQAFDEAVERHAKDGRRLAAMSNAGLPAGQQRLSFLPESAFTRRVG